MLFEKARHSLCVCVATAVAVTAFFAAAIASHHLAYHSGETYHPGGLR